MSDESSGPSSHPASRAPTKVLGRYALFDELASGGMATVHLGRLLGPVGFSRTVAIKRLHPQHAKDPEFVAMFLDEARLAARIRHPNVVATLDVVATEGEVFLVMEYVEGESLSYLVGALRKRGERMPPRVAAHVVAGALQGLHAAHEAKNDRGEPLNLVHRDVSPQNILVGVDGVARVLDFGVAKAMGRLQTTDEGRVKGKLAYMAPEQLSGRVVTPRTDVFAATIVLWEALTGRRLFQGADPGEVVTKVLSADIPLPSSLAPDVSPALDAVVAKGLSRDPAKRFASALEMVAAIEDASGLVPAREVGEWIKRVAPTRLSERAQKVAEVESSSSVINFVFPASTPSEAIAAHRASQPTLTEGGTGRSQVGSVIDPTPSVPKRGVARWLPIAAGAALVCVVAGAFLLLRARASSSAEQTPSALVTTAQASPVPSAPATLPEPSAESAPPPSASAETAPPPSASVTAPASAAPKPVAKPVRMPKAVQQANPKSEKPSSLYSRY